jgi:crotonobetaine/carnitine-CoA ligase
MTVPQPRNILQAVAAGRDARGADTLLTFVDVGADGRLVEERRSYADLWRNGSAICEALRSEGMKPGDSFALIMNNHAEFVDTMVGSAMAGTVFVPLDPRIGGAKLRFMLELAECRGAVVAGYALDHLLAVLGELPLLQWIWVVEGALPPAIDGTSLRLMDAILAAGHADEPLRAIDPGEPMQMIFTSGTTGDPKAILSPHGRFAFATSLGSMVGLTASDRPYTGLPLSHSNAQLMTLGNALAMGLPCVISRKFTKSRLWEILGRYGCTTFNLLGGMTTAIFAEPAGPYDRAHQVRFVLSAGMPTSMWRDFADRFGVEIFEFYGTAEGGLLLNPPGGPIGSIGKPPPGTVCEILDQDGRALPDGMIGELCFRNSDGSVAPVEYYRNGKASVEKTAGGWFHSGDMGWRDKEGWYFFAHRKGTAIRRNGEFIAPGEVEKLIAEAPGVADVFVYGAATRSNAPGEREVVAAIVPARGDFSADEIFRRCRKALPANSQPRILQLLDEIPKTASEKPQERFLFDLLKDGACTIISADGTGRIDLGPI